MRYKVWDIEENKERTLENCVTPLEVGTVRRANEMCRNRDRRYMQTHPASLEPWATLAQEDAELTAS